MRTLAVQTTLAPLNSRPSSFSTAVLRSAAVSNSTKLLHPFISLCLKDRLPGLTLFHLGHDRSRSRRRRGWIDARSLSDPISDSIVSCCPGRMLKDARLRCGNTVTPLDSPRDESLRLVLHSQTVCNLGGYPITTVKSKKIWHNAVQI